MRVRQLSEIILYVQNVPLEAIFYRDRLGLEQTFPDHDVDLSQENWVTFDAGGVTLALHSQGEGQMGQDGPVLVFTVENLDLVHAELVAEGVDLDEIEELEPGLRLARGRDPEGFPFTLEHAPDED